MIAEAETKNELRKRRIPEEEFRKKKIALAAEKEVNLRLETMLSTRCYRIEEGRGSDSEDGELRESGALVTKWHSEQQSRSTAAAPEGHSLEEKIGSTLIPGRQTEGQVGDRDAAPEQRALEEGWGAAVVTGPGGGAGQGHGRRH